MCSVLVVPRFPGVTPFAFISYARADGLGYVTRLSAHMEELQLPHWFDRDVVTGDRWEHVIVDKLTTSAALVVVMTTAGRVARGYSNPTALAEIARAEGAAAEAAKAFNKVTAP